MQYSKVIINVMLKIIKLNSVLCVSRKIHYSTEKGFIKISSTQKALFLSHFNLLKSSVILCDMLVKNNK